MSTSMVTRDADTFVALGRAVSLAASEGALRETESVELASSLVVALLTGGMELDAYTRLHQALARLLEKAFDGPTRRTGSASASLPHSGAGEENLGVYLEVVGEAWETVSWENESPSRLKTFVRRSFDLSRSRFGEGAWFRAPLRTDFDTLLRTAKSAGLLIVSAQGEKPSGSAEGILGDPSAVSTHSRVVIGWGERRVALELAPLPA